MDEFTLGRAKPQVIAGLDIGTTKIACLIARIDPPRDESDPGITVLGLTQQAAQGIARGTVVDVPAAENSIRAAVDAAEHMAGMVVQKVWVNLSTPTLSTHHTYAELPLGDDEITVTDLRKVAAQARTEIDLSGRVLVHAVPITYLVDGSAGIRDPRGMVGERLGVDMHIVGADQSPVRNLMLCVKRCHLEVAGLVAAPYASALSTLVPDEMDLGVTLIEMGGGTTSIAIFYEGRLVHTDVITLGGQHVTADVARGLSTRVDAAERIKTLHGSALPAPSDDREMIEVPGLGSDDGTQTVPRSLLTKIIQPRIEETLELVRERIVRSGLESVAGRRIVLTGGAAQLTGVREITSRMLDKPVRIGRPLGVVGFPEALEGPAFATCAGLVAYTVRAPQEAPRADAFSRRAGTASPFARIKSWFTASL